MKITLHAANRMATRGIKQVVINVVNAYGVEKGDKVVLTKRMATQRLDEARCELRQLESVLDFGGSSLSDALHCIDALETEIKALERIARTRGLTVVCVDETLVTTYWGSIQIKIH